MTACIADRGRAKLGFVLMAVGIGSVIAGPGHAAGSLPVTWDSSQRGQPLNLAEWQLAFREEFNAPVSFRGPKLFAPIHAPWGAGRLDDPDGPAYSFVSLAPETAGEAPTGALKLTAYKTETGWHSGSVQTADADQSHRGKSFDGSGFLCRNCYFEARIRFPAGVSHAYWGAFWLLSPDDPKTGHVEIDALEWYGTDPGGHHSTVHVWPVPRSGHAYRSHYTGMPGLTDGAWHRYGVRREPGRITIYLDQKEVSRVAVGPEFDVGYYALVSLVISPRDLAKANSDPKDMFVDYIRAYAQEAGAR